jgi:hypothetical protein
MPITNFREPGIRNDQFKFSKFRKYPGSLIPKLTLTPLYRGKRGLRPLLNICIISKISKVSWLNTGINSNLLKDTSQNFIS